MSNNNSGNGMLYFLVGALCVAVLVGGFIMFGGATLPSSTQSTAQAPASTPAPTTTKNITIEKKTIETPKVIERDERRDR